MLRAMSDTRCFVLLHGAWHGGWCWARVAPLLRARGHVVFTPTQTGLGERAHLLSPAVTLETFISDLTGVLEAEELTGAVLVGHSFAGLAITGAADRMPGRIRRLIYLDSRILEHGASSADADPALAESRRQAAARLGGLAIPPPPPAAFGVPPGPDADWLARRMTPHPLRTMEDRLSLSNPAVGNGLPCTYVACTDPIYPPLDASRRWARGRTGWEWREIAAGHDCMVTAPEACARLLEEIAA
jgi:pimeloyl-ACP methyl ester carboxylesterase